MMIRRSTGRRPGLSLMEVLVGFGILGIAVPAVITLYPFSALTLGQALRDDRTSTCAVTADGLLRDIHTRYVVEGNGSEPYFYTMDGGGTTGLPQLAADGNPSYPVLVDPMGFYARGGAPLGDGGLAKIPRVSLKMIEDYAITSPATNRATLSLRLCSQMDGLSYGDDGEVLPNSATMRELRYNWLWVVQRPVNRDRFTVRMQVVAFDKRAHLYAPPRSEAVYPNISFTPGETAILNVPATAELRKGSWVMDATIGFDAANRPLRHAEFYRVLSVSDAANGTLTLEVHRPISRPDGQYSASNPAAYGYFGTLVSMPAVADVFERPMMTAGDGPVMTAGSVP